MKMPKPITEFAPENRVAGWPDIGDHVKVFLPWAKGESAAGERVWAQVVGSERGCLKVRIDSFPLDERWDYDDVILVHFVHRAAGKLMLSPLQTPPE
jgi:hypothetical protein